MELHLAPKTNGYARLIREVIDLQTLTQALLDQYGLPHEAFMEMSTALDDPQWENRPRSRTVSMRLPDYKAALTPVLQYARTLDLIDPYITPHQDRFFDVVSMCAGLLGRGRYRIGSRRISIHAGDPQKDGETPADRLAAWRDALSRLVNADAALRFRVFLWSGYGRAELLHDRFIVTDQCCISVPAGLDVRREGTTSWSLLDEELRREQLSKFSATSSVYTPLGNIEVVK